MLFKDFFIEAQLTEAEAGFTQPVFEAVNGYLMKTIAVLGNRSDDDTSEAGIDMSRLADVITTLKIIGNRQLRTSITKDDVGYDPNSIEDMYDVLTKVPDSPKNSMSSDVGSFFKKTAGLAPKIKKEELDALKALVSSDEKIRRTALQQLKILATKVDQMYNKLKTSVKK